MEEMVMSVMAVMTDDDGYVDDKDAAADGDNSGYKDDD